MTIGGAAALGCSPGRASTAAAPGDPPPAVIASPRVASVAVYRAPTDPAAFEQLPDRTSLGSRRVLLVREARDQWLRVLLPQRPDGSEGWVRRSDMLLTKTYYRIDVSLRTHQLVVRDGTQVVASVTVANGATGTPTPSGIYYVTDIVKVPANEPWYGPDALGLSGYSPTLQTFDGGDAEIAVHGTDQPQLLGLPVTHGCLRIPNATVAELARRLPLGTPVVIQP